MKLWGNKRSADDQILAFTTGKDPEYDLLLAPYDVAGTMAHAIMLGEVGLISREEAGKVLEELSSIYIRTLKADFELDSGVEDIHSQVELLLTRSLGDLGKKIHTGRSRNDQVMVDIKLFLREELNLITGKVLDLSKGLIGQARKYRDIPMPGYTHMQVAMPSSFGLWFGAYAEALADDLDFLECIYRVINQNPLGSAAGYGSSFPLDRELTTKLLGFEKVHVSSVNAQLNRGKTEWYMATGMAAVASTMARLSMDTVLFMGQNFNFLSLPGELTTGSSIMPHKKNPDVLELVRAKCNRLVHLPGEISSVTTNLPSGYHRDFQLLKEILLPALQSFRECIDILLYVVERMEVNPSIMGHDTYKYIYSVEEVNRKVKNGIPFRDAYREVAEDIENGRFAPGRDHSYSHLGSIGNPGLDEIESKLENAYGSLRPVKSTEIVNALRTYYMET